MFTNASTAILHFVVGHEYGHFAAKHVFENTRGASPFTPGTTIERNWYQELEADFAGFTIAAALEAQISKHDDLTPAQLLSFGAHLDF